jgi:hypothetical protein
MKNPEIKRFGLFDFDTLTVRFGGTHSKPENVFTAQAIKVPDFKYITMEQADAGGGCYYSYKEPVEHTQRNAYIIIKDNEVIGWMDPYKGMKSELLAITGHARMLAIKNFALKWEKENAQAM